MLRLLALLLALAGCAAAPAAPRRPERPPNVVLILADDLGYECLGADGGTSYATPRLDDMARRGLRFTEGHATPLCTPSRAELLTGRLGFRNYERFGYLDPAERTLGGLFRDAGYATCVVGKWQLSYGVDDPRRPAAFGFETWCLWNTDEERGSRYQDPTLNVDGARGTHPGAFGPDLACDHGLRFIEGAGDAPFFLYYPMILPHAPFVRTPASPPGERTRAERFGDMVAYADTLVGRVLDRLQELGVAEDTLVLFVGDNGTDRAITSTWRGEEVRGGKSLLQPTGTHVPLLALWPGHLEAGTCDELVGLADFVPTLAALCGLDPDGDRPLDGHSFAHCLLGAEGPRRPPLVWHYDPRWNVPGRPGRAAYDGRHWLAHDGQLFDTDIDRALEHPIESPAETAPETWRALRAALDALPPWDPPARARRPGD